MRLRCLNDAANFTALTQRKPSVLRADLVEDNVDLADEIGPQSGDGGIYLAVLGF